MPLNLYRRHFRIAGKCAGGHAADSRNHEPEELRRAWKKCSCPIYADGTLAGDFRRGNTKKTTWTEARAVVAAWERAGRWDEDPLPPASIAPPSPAEAKPCKPSTTIEFATDAYLANRAGRDIAQSTLRKYGTFVKQLKEFSAAKGYVMIDQIGSVDMDEFYGGWRDGVRAKAKKLERLGGFFNFCIKRKWITENPAADLEAPVGAGAAANRMPLTDAELTKIYDTCDRLPKVEWKNHLGEGVWGGEDVKTMIMLLCWTGLRISDAATFDMSRVSRHQNGGANIFLRMHKTQGAFSRGSMIGSTNACWPASASPDRRFSHAGIPNGWKPSLIYGADELTASLIWPDHSNAAGPLHMCSGIRSYACSCNAEFRHATLRN